MNRSRNVRDSRRKPKSFAAFRPRLVVLEQRMAPGDALFGVLWGLPGIDLAPPSVAADQVTPEANRVHLTDWIEGAADPLAVPAGSRSKFRPAVAPDRPAQTGDSFAEGLPSTPVAASPTRAGGALSGPAA